MSNPLLKIRDLHVSVSDGEQILHGVDLDIHPGEIHVLMGPNGAGKSTLGNAIMGNPAYTIDQGTIEFDGKDITNETTDKRAKAGLFLSFQNPIEVPGISLNNFIRNASEEITGSHVRLWKFRKQLEKSVFQNFSDRFGVSDQTRDVLGKAYLDIEEAEAKAEADDLDAVKQVYQSRKDALKQELCGCGKEARKLLEHYKKASKARIDAFVEEINLGYAAFEEDLKRFMVEYELEVSAEDACAEDAAKAYCEKLEASYEAHRSALADSRAQTEQNLNEIAEEYSEIAKGFRTHPENEAEEEPAAADAEATEEVPAEDTEITENVETPAQNADPA